MKETSILDNVNQIRPISDNILVKRVPEQDMTAGGIVIPANAKKPKMEALVLAVGRRATTAQGKQLDQPMTVKVGDRVLIDQFVGSALTIDGESYILMHERHVHAVLEEGSVGEVLETEE